MLRVIAVIFTNGDREMPPAVGEGGAAGGHEGVDCWGFVGAGKVEVAERANGRMEKGVMVGAAAEGREEGDDREAGVSDAAMSNEIRALTRLMALVTSP